MAGIETTLIDRIDLALQHARLSRTELAEGLGVSRQAISNLKRRPGSSLRIDHVAHAARMMHCDLYWLCTGEGDYRPEGSDAMLSPFIFKLATVIQRLPEPLQDRVCRLVFMMTDTEEEHLAELNQLAMKGARRTRP